MLSREKSTEAGACVPRQCVCTRHCARWQRLRAMHQAQAQWPLLFSSQTPVYPPATMARPAHTPTTAHTQPGTLLPPLDPELGGGLVPATLASPGGEGLAAGLGDGLGGT